MKKLSEIPVLVTGGNGAIGCNLIRKLLELQAKVTVLDDFSQSNKGNLPIHTNLKKIKGDISNEKILAKTFSKKYDYVFHLAARFANEMSVKNPYEDLRVNVEGTLKILLHSAKNNVKRFLYTSSSSIYGNQKVFPIKENAIPNPATPYAASKLSGEFYCKAIHELYGIDFSIIRISNSYGPFDPPGKFRNVIPNFIKSAINGKNLIITGSGKETRDFTYVDDVVDGIILAATKKNGKNEIFNIGTGKETKIKKIVDTILKLTKSDSDIIYRPRRSFDHVTRRKMDISKAKHLLGYSPKTTLVNGLEKTYNWFATNR